MLEISFEELVEDEKNRLRVLSEAKRQISEENGRFRPVTFSNERTEPKNVSWRVEGLLPANGYVLIQAKRKAGKTTLIMNLVRALTSAGTFLGEFPACGYARVGLLDMEMSENRHKCWLRDVGLLKEKRLYTDYLRGRAMSLSLFDNEHRRALAEHLTDIGIDVLIIDPLGPLLRAYGVDENSNSEVGRVVDYLIKLKEESEVSELIVVHHQGKDGAMGARGASVLEDTPDAVWTLTGPSGRPADKLSAFGRDVDESRMLLFNPDTRELTAASADDGGDYGSARSAASTNAILSVIGQSPGISSSSVYEKARNHGYTGNKERFFEDLKALGADGKIVNLGSGARHKWFAAEAGE